MSFLFNIRLKDGLQIRTKDVSLAANILLIGVTLVYLYGYLFNNVTDCGCFGAFDMLNLPPIGVFIRKRHQA
ncbi:hypothetical protein AGMMS49965_14610 [Bacteroidia bacterium]|nr:hypothetical protein AGMMS49965_14610 [Bacteroidia bacterium]